MALPRLIAQASFSIDSPALLVASQTNLGFGSESGGTGGAVTRTFTVQNEGMVNLPGAAFNSRQYYPVNNGCTASRLPGSTCIVTIDFDPPSTFTSTDSNWTLHGISNSANSFTVSISGTGAL